MANVFALKVHMCCVKTVQFILDGVSDSCCYAIGKVLDPGTPDDPFSGMMLYTKEFQFLFGFEQLKIFQERCKAPGSAFRPTDLFLGLPLVILKHNSRAINNIMRICSPQLRGQRLVFLFVFRQP